MSREDKHREGNTPTPREPPDPDKLSEKQPTTPFDDVTDHTTDSASSEPTEETNEISDEQEEDPTSEVLDGDFDIFDPAEDGEVENEEPIAISADYELSSDASLSGTLSNDETEKFIEEIESEQEYIQITPVREEVNSETVTRELYGLHGYGNGRKLPFDLGLHLGFIKSRPNFEFIIYKPADEAQFKFFIGPGERGDVTCDRLESTTRSQYPENFEFDREHFDITNVFDEVPEMIRWEGIEEKRRDWMTTLASYDNEAIERSPLSNLLETSSKLMARSSSSVFSSHDQTGHRKQNARKETSNKESTRPAGSSFARFLTVSLASLMRKRKSAIGVILPMKSAAQSTTHRQVATGQEQAEWGKLT